MPNLLVETSVGARLSDNLLNHAQIIYGVGPELPRAEHDRARLGVAPDPELAGMISRSTLKDGAAAFMVPRLLVLAADDPTAEGVRRALTKPRLPVLGGEVVARVGRGVLRLDADALELMWQVCEQFHAAHYRLLWASREASIQRLAREADERLAYAEVPRKLEAMTAREPPHADLEVNLLDSEALISYAGGGERVCISTALLSRFERFVYVFTHECARIYLHNPRWWEVEPCAAACQGLPGTLLDAIENCAAHYIAATLALHYGPDPGFCLVHPAVEQALARRWPAFVAAPSRGVDLMLEQVLRELHEAGSHTASGAPPAGVRPLRPSVTYDDVGNPRHCALSERRF